MKTIKTVTGDIKPKDLGWCQCHEHIFLADGPSKQINPALCMDDYDKSLNELLLYKAAGGSAIVDCQPGGFGRMAQNLVIASKESGINIITVTGFHKLEFAEDIEYWNKKSADEIAQFWIDEIQNGMYENNIQLHNKAGIIKCAIAANKVLTNAAYDKLFEAACLSAKETNAPVLFHVDGGTDVFEAIEYFEKSGVSTDNLIFCHLDRAKYDFEYHKDVANSGAYLQYDTIMRTKYHSNEDEIKLIKRMIDEGLSDRLLFGLDTTNQRLKSYGADFGLDYILTDFIHQLLSSNIEEGEIKKIMISNPAGVLSF